MKVSVVVTVLNEEDTIAQLLESLLVQTRRPNQIVVVDGGSMDRTRDIVREYQKQFKKIKLIMEIGSIAHGRNVAIKTAKHSIIAQIDAGCIAEEDWLEQIISPFKDLEVGVVAGFYKMTGTTYFQKAICPYFGVHPRRFDPRTFMPSGRSVAFRKSVWQTVDGYSEFLERAGEDTLFNYKILKHGIKMIRVKEAIAYWEVPERARDAIRKLYLYAKGDAQAGIWWHPAQRLSTHNIKITLIILRYIMGLIMLLLSIFYPPVFLLLIIAFIFYLFWSIKKTEDIVHDFYAKLWVPIIQVVSDITVMLGFISGLASKIRLRIIKLSGLPKKRN